MPFDTEQQSHEQAGHQDMDGSGEPTVAGGPVVVRRHAGVAALVGGAASTVAIAYLWRASQSMTLLDWSLFTVMALIAGVYLVSLVDARTPLLVADDLGLRIRLGDEWRGLPWDAIGQVVVHPRKGVLRDGRLVFVPRSLARALDGLDTKAKRHVALNQKMYGAALAVPVGSTTRVFTAGERSVADEIAALAQGHTDVVELEQRTPEVLDRSERPEDDLRESAVSGQEHPAALQREVFPKVHDTRSPGTEIVGEPRGATPAEEPSGAGVRGAGSASSDWRKVWKRFARPEARSASASAPEGDDEPAEPTGGSATDPATVLSSPTEGSPAGRGSRRSVLGGIGTIVSRVAKGRAHDVDGGGVGSLAAPGADPAAAAPDAEAAPAEGSEASADLEVSPSETAASEAAPAVTPPARAAALRQTRPALRAEATLHASPTAGSAALDPSRDEDSSRKGLPEGRELRRPGSVDLVFERVEVDDRVRPISTLGEPVAPLVIDDYVTEPAYDPVIGPELSAARTRLGLSVDDLAERTRIRPHVIESIEVDDFAPCGGDFYARGHLRTLARILGINVGPLLEKFEERYATAPINARRVFEAELATGMTGSMRATVGGPSWGLLIGVVLTLVLLWGVLRLFTAAPDELPSPVVNGSAAVPALVVTVDHIAQPGAPAR